ncbi:MAG: integrase [Candidatus Epulonipiscioides saccharophilum]|nr:MAG: integrase [Epulopiscium sp. AS2M-Bin001]
MTTYKEDLEIRQIISIDKLLDNMPDFVYEFIKGIEHTTAPSTRLNYLYDLRLFLTFLTSTILNNKKIMDITLSDLQRLSTRNIEKFMIYITSYETTNSAGNKVQYQNRNISKARKLATIKSMFKYLNKRNKIDTNPATLIDMPKQTKKVIVKLDTDEIPKLLNVIETGQGLTPKALHYQDKTRLRDIAMVSLMLGTGIRVSECVGININDVNLQKSEVTITRKGGNQTIIYFGLEVKEALLNYYKERKLRQKDNPDGPLFLSLQKRRISIRMVEILIKKYSVKITKMKKITPHKLRSTYGTYLYQQTGDIYLVADLLGHKDINTTQKYYASMSEEKRKGAVNIVKLH